MLQTLARADQRIMVRRRCPGPLLSALALASDAAAIAVAAALAALLSSDPGGAAAAALPAALVIAGTLLLSASGGLAHPAAVLAPRTVAPALPVAFLAVLLLAEAGAVVGLAAVPTAAPVLAVAGGALLVGGRLALAPLAAWLARDSVHRIALYGEAEACRRFLSRLQAAPTGLASVAALHLLPRQGAGPGCETVPLDALVASVRSGVADTVVLALPAGGGEAVVRAGGPLANLAVPVYLLAGHAGSRWALRPAPGPLSRLGLLEVARPPLWGWRSGLKRASDVALAAVLLLALSPLLALVALAIRLDSPGPVLFRQRRLGFNGRVFSICKFRSMTVEASREAGPLRQAAPGDARVTRVGRLLRRSSLDELPQLLNVLDGSMSIVGPRPHALCHDALYGGQIRGYLARHRVRPGITGWAQVNGFRGMTSDPELMERRVRHDLDYVENWSLLFDLRILALTVPAVLRARNAY